MAHVVISKLVKIKPGRRDNDYRYTSEVLVVLFGRCRGKRRMMYRENASGFELGGTDQADIKKKVQEEEHFKYK